MTSSEGTRWLFSSSLDVRREEHTGGRGEVVGVVVVGVWGCGAGSEEEQVQKEDPQIPSSFPALSPAVISPATVLSQSADRPNGLSCRDTRKRNGFVIVGAAILRKPANSLLLSISLLLSLTYITFISLTFAMLSQPSRLTSSASPAF